MCQRLRLPPPSRNRADLAADALSFSSQPKLPQLPEQLSGQWHGPCQQAPIILMMLMAGMNLTPPPGGGGGLVCWPSHVPSSRKKDAVAGDTLHARRYLASSSGVSQPRGRAPGQVQQAALPCVEARHDDRLPELADFLLVRQRTRRGDAMSEVSRQTTHGEWKDLSNQGRLDVSLESFLGGCCKSNYCACAPAKCLHGWSLCPVQTSVMPEGTRRASSLRFLSYKSKTGMDWDASAQHEHTRVSVDI